MNRAELLMTLTKEAIIEGANKAIDVFEKEIDKVVLVEEIIGRENDFDIDECGVSLKIKYKFNDYRHTISVRFHYGKMKFEAEFHSDNEMSSKQKLVYHKAKVVLEEFIEKANYNGC